MIARRKSDDSTRAIGFVYLDEAIVGTAEFERPAELKRFGFYPQAPALPRDGQQRRASRDAPQTLARPQDACI